MDNGLIFCLSNALSPAHDPLRKFKISAYDNYKIMFTAYDNFNRALHVRKWPRKSGGKKSRGERGHQHAFAMAVILKNAFNLFKKVRNLRKDHSCFRDMCYDLADGLWEAFMNM